MQKLTVGQTVDISFEGEVNPVKVIGIGYFDNKIDHYEVMVDPETDDAFYAELYLEDYGSWEVSQ